MKFNFSLESDNLEDDLKKIIETVTEAICRDTDRELTRMKALNQVDATEQVKGLDNRIDGVESRLNLCEVDLKKVKESTKKSDK